LKGSTAGDTLTYKGPKQPSRFKARLEHEVIVSDADTALRILQSTGFVTRLSFEKKRETWSFSDCLVALDELPVLGRFVEIEGPSEDAIDSVRHRLGLGGLPHMPKGYVAMLSRWCAENAITDRRIVFGPVQA
jgi:adenylate cyclase class 2